MLTALQKRKLTHQFNCHDINGNGYIERDDYESMVEKVNASFGYKLGTPEYEGLYRGTMQGWERILKGADRSGDGRVNLDEYLAGHDAWLADRETYRAWMISEVENWFRVSDRDGDGFIVEEEYAKDVAPLGISAEDARVAWKRLDRNGRGKLTKEEMLLNLEEFYYSDDPDAPGNWVLGRLRP